MLLATGTPMLADEQSDDEESTRLPPGIALAVAEAAARAAESTADIPDTDAAALAPTRVVPETLAASEQSAEAELDMPDAPDTAAAEPEPPLPQADDELVLDQEDGLVPDMLEPVLARNEGDEEAIPLGHVDPAQRGDGTDDDSPLWGPPVPDPATNEFGAAPIWLLGSEVAPGSRENLYWTTGQSFSGSVMETPVVVVHGLKPGPRLCLVAGVHGDELNGIEVVRRLAYKIPPEQLAGTVVGVPIVNLLGFSRGSRYLPDRRDLNRFFPGSPSGSSASRIAHSFFFSIISHCDALVDVHTGSLDRANLPQVRGDLRNPLVLEFTRGFGATAVLHSPGTAGMLRHAASARGIPAVTFEIGGPLRLQPEEIAHGEQAIETLLNKMGMIEQRRRWRGPQAVYYESRWIRVDHGGMLLTDVVLGERVRAGQRLGRVIDPVSNRSAEVVAPEAGRIIGMALNQLVLPGFAAYNLGTAASEEQVALEAGLDAELDDERYLESEPLDEARRLPEKSERNGDEERRIERMLEHGSEPPPPSEWPSWEE